MERCPWIDPVVLNHQLDGSVVRYQMQLAPIKLSVWTLVSMSMHNISLWCNNAYIHAWHDATITSSLLGLSIIASGSPIAGESYTLECSAGGSEGTFQWLGPPDGRTPVIENSPRVTITSNTVSSQLQFRPVQQSDNGSYSCSATVDRSTSFSDSLNVIINGTVIIILSLSIMTL